MDIAYICGMGVTETLIRQDSEVSWGVVSSMGIKILVTANLLNFCWWKILSSRPTRGNSWNFQGFHLPWFSWFCSFFPDFTKNGLIW